MFMDDIKSDYFYPMGGTSVVLELQKGWVQPCDKQNWPVQQL